MVGLTGLEPVTPRLSSVCSNQLSYRSIHMYFLILHYFVWFCNKKVNFSFSFLIAYIEYTRKIFKVKPFLLKYS